MQIRKAGIWYNEHSYSRREMETVDKTKSSNSKRATGG